MQRGQRRAVLPSKRGGQQHSRPISFGLTALIIAWLPAQACMAGQDQPGRLQLVAPDQGRPVYSALSTRALPEPEMTRQKPVATATQKVNINEASAEELAEVLQGIGLKKARAIVEYRRRYGPFESKQMLMRVRGIGKKTLMRNKDRIILGLNQRGR